MSCRQGQKEDIVQILDPVGLFLYWAALANHASIMCESLLKSLGLLHVMIANVFGVNKDHFLQNLHSQLLWGKSRWW
jgi:hypothetical protein